MTENDSETVGAGQAGEAAAENAEVPVAEAQVAEAAAVGAPPADAPGSSGVAGTIRAALDDSAARGAPMVSAQAMQARLFQVYDDASAVPEALALVQRHLRLTLDRTWYSPHEVDDLADQLDWLLGLGAGHGSGDGPEADEPAAAAAG